MQPLGFALVLLSEEVEPLQGDGGPPFLQERTSQVGGSTVDAPFVDRVAEFIDRWRVGLAMLVAPLVLVGLGLISLPRGDGADTLRAETDSAIVAMVNGIGGVGAGVTDKGADGQANLSPAPGPLPSTDTGTPRTLDPAGATTVVPGLPRPNPTSPSDGTTTTTSSSTSTTSTTELPSTTTVPPSTQPPPTATETTLRPGAPCRVTLRRATKMYDAPGGGRELGKIDEGTYDGLAFAAVPASWFLIEAGGQVGWVGGRRVSLAEGSCPTIGT